MDAPGGRAAPIPPIAFDRADDEIRARFAAAAVAVDDAVIARIGDVCPAVDTTLRTRIEASRDWWPLAVGWAHAGEVAAVAAVVARPSCAAEVAAVLAVCDDARVPVTATGGRSGVSGASVPVFGGVVLDMTGLEGVVDVDNESLLVDVLPGTFGHVLEDRLRAGHGLTLGHWPQSMNLSTVGGWVACRGAGQYSTRYGKIEDMVTGLEVALADGRVIRTGGRAPRSATGPDLTQLFVGSEGTLGIVTEVTFRAHPVPPAERRLAFGFQSFGAGLESCRRILRRGATPAVLRLYDASESRTGFGLADTHLLLVRDEGDAVVVDAVMAVVAEEAVAGGAQPQDVTLVQHWLDRRQDVSALEKAVRAGLTVDTIEVAARWPVVAPLYHAVIEGVGGVEGTLAVSAHQSHTYPDGACLYFTFAGLPAAGEPSDSYYRQIWDLVMAITTARGGTISHHHGIGLNRARHLAGSLGPAFDVLVLLKQALDPRGILNPGKLGLPSPFGEVPWP